MTPEVDAELASAWLEVLEELEAEEKLAETEIEPEEEDEDDAGSIIE